MLPPDLAAFTFTFDRAGSDDALAARALSALPRGRVVVAGAQRRGLLVALAQRGLEVVAFDPTRGALPLARHAAEQAGVAERLTLFASDPRDFDVPDGADAALLPSSTWRLLTHDSARTAALACFRRALRPGGLLLLDADRAPAEVGSEDAPLRAGPGKQVWTARRGWASDTIVVTVASPGVEPCSVELHDLSPERTADQVRAAGFDVATVADAATGGAFGADSARAWIVARLAARP